jgi:hypothetical protein
MARHRDDLGMAVAQDGALIWPEVQSRILRPSASVNQLPRALSAIRGEKAPP